MDLEVVGSEPSVENYENLSNPEPVSETPPQLDAINTEFKEHFHGKQLIFINDLKSTSLHTGYEGDMSSVSARLNKEIKVLSRGLPCDVAAPIFLAVDSTEFNYMRGIIAGSEGVPYAHGLFFFDIYCGSSYPEAPPQFILTTTGGGEAYFGPNLYSNGYVCLSIINTWSGDPEEQWSPNKNILQVLLSIQALVMDNHIIQKEPGWEILDVNCSDSIMYQMAVKYLNIKSAMLENIRNPPIRFDELINTYFRIKKEMILKEVNSWLTNAKDCNLNMQNHESFAENYNPKLCQRFVSEGYHKVLSEIAKELKEELDSRYGVTDIELDLFVEPENQQQALEGPHPEIQIIADDPLPSVGDAMEIQASDLNLQMVNPFTDEQQQINIEPGEDMPAPLTIDQYSAHIPDTELNENYPSEMPVPAPILFREPSASDPEAPESSHQYFQDLGNYRLQILEESEGYFSNYSYEHFPINEQGLSRLNKEIKALTRSLPCEPNGSIFLAINSSNMSIMNVLISGTDDSPYEHGLFLFDIKLPEDYPNNPPQMSIRTTGNSTFRFNPNLYDSGYVCLSIINTWGGDPEEMWNPTYSTLLQVFLSIQALVMDKNVLQKEPGYEYYDSDSLENRQYRAIVSLGTLKYAITDMLREPPKEFEHIVKKHFLHKREKILETAEKWREEATNIDMSITNEIVLSHNPNAITELTNAGFKYLFDIAFEELKVELNKL